jgi:uncharacterized MAPEG superfamily protein
MSIAILCVLLAYLLPYGFVMAAKSGKGFDNAKPREYLAGLQGWRQRANWVQMNHYENFAPFAVGVAFCLQTGVTASQVNILAAAFVAARLIYGFCYIFDYAAARSLVWSIAQVCVVSLYVMAMGA